MTPLLPTLLAAAILQAALPDFSGVWRLDTARSETLNEGGEIEPGPVTLTQSGASFRVAPSAAGRAAVTYTILTPAARTAAGPVAAAQAYWDGPALVTEAEGLVNGKSVTLKQTRTLGPGGAEMIVDTTVAIQHGYKDGDPLPQSKARDIYVRVGR